MAQQVKKLSNYLKFSYGFADLGFIFMVTMSNSYLLIFFTDVAGIAVGAAGVLMMVGRIIDTLSPSVIGAVIERSNPKRGKYRSAIMVGAPLILILNCLVFIDVPIGMPLKAIIACITYAAFCIATNIAYIGYTSLNSSLTNDPGERVQLSTLRGQGNAAGKILCGFLILPMITFFGGGMELSKQGFVITAFVVGAICLLLYLNLINSTKNLEHGLAKSAVASKPAEKVSVGETFKMVATNRPLLLLFLADVGRIMNMLILFAMFPYFFKYCVGDVNASAIFFGIVNILAFVGASSVPFVSKFISKKNMYLIGNIMLATGLILAGIFSSNVTLIIVFISIGYIGYAWANVVNTAMYADTVDYCQWKTGKNARAVFFSMYQMSIKIAAIFSTGIAGLGLAAVGFIPNVEPTAEVIKGINFMAMGLPAALLIAGAVLIFFYNLNEKKMAEIRKDLAEGKTANA